MVQFLKLEDAKARKVPALTKKKPDTGRMDRKVTADGKKSNKVNKVYCELLGHSP